jgi:cell division protein FtsQ
MVGALGLAAILATGDRARRLVAWTAAAADSRLASLGLAIGVVHLQGASPAAQAEILQAAALRTGMPILTLDLDAVRTRVEKVAWVKSARIVRLWPDTVVIAIEQRPLMAVWEHAGRIAVVANDGAVVAKADPARYASLPLIVGAGANLAVAMILPQVAARPRLRERLEALIRVDERRWDLRLKDGTLVQLPADGEGEALARLDELDRKSRVLELGLARIDLRDPAMVVVRPREGVAPVLASGGV